MMSIVGKNKPDNTKYLAATDSLSVVKALKKMLTGDRPYISYFMLKVQKLK